MNDNVTTTWVCAVIHGIVIPRDATVITFRPKEVAHQFTLYTRTHTLLLQHIR